MIRTDLSKVTTLDICFCLEVHWLDSSCLYSTLLAILRGHFSQRRQCTSDLRLPRQNCTLPHRKTFELAPTGLGNERWVNAKLSATTPPSLCGPSKRGAPRTCTVAASAGCSAKEAETANLETF